MREPYQQTIFECFWLPPRGQNCIRKLNGCVRKLNVAFGNSAVVFGLNTCIRKLNVCIRKLNSCIRKLTLVFGNLCSETALANMHHEEETHGKPKQIILTFLQLLRARKFDGIMGCSLSPFPGLHQINFSKLPSLFWLRNMAPNRKLIRAA